MGGLPKVSRLSRRTARQVSRRVEKDGSVAALKTEDIKDGTPRQIGQVAEPSRIGFGKLTCPNGEAR